MSLQCQINNVNLDLLYSNDIEENIISISSKKEVFFDVFECYINDGKIILEKVDESDSGPKVLIELVIEGKKYSAEAVLVDNGKTYVKVNKELIYLQEQNEIIYESISEEPESQIIESDHTGQLAELITNYNNNLKEEHLDKLKSYTEEYQEKISQFEDKKNEVLSRLNEEFDKNLTFLKTDIEDKLQLFLTETDKETVSTVKSQTKKLNKDIYQNFKSFKQELKALDEFNRKDIINLISEKNNEVEKSVTDFLTKISKQYGDELLNLREATKKIKDKNNLYNKKFNELKVLKEEINKTDVDYSGDINKQNKKIKNALEYINNKFDSLNRKLSLLSEKDNNRYNEILATVNKQDPNEYKTVLTGKIKEAEINSLREELKEDFTQTFQSEARNLRRYAEMSAGGGSNAVQYANGGTMNGNLTVTGEISANKIMAATVLSGTTLDIGFELSGFNVTGNISANGNLSATNITVTDDMSAKDIIKSGRLNVGSGNLFVDDGTSTGNAFVKIGAYGAGNFFGKEGSVNGAAFSLGVGTAGKIVEDMKIDTFALSGAGLVNKTTNPVILVPSPGANKYNVPVSIQVYKSQSGGTRVAWGVGTAAISIGVFASSDTTGTFSQLTSLPRGTALIAGDWLYNRNQGPDTTNRVISNRALAFRTSSDIASNTSADVYYLKVRYMVMSEDGDFKSIANLQIKDS
mgnify:CR=1 FL=1